MKKLTAILCLCLILTSCGSTEQLPKETTEAATTTESVTTETRYTPELPDMDFGGRTFTFVDYQTPDERYVMNCNYDIFAEGETGDPINDAVYHRNRYVEEKYKLKIAEYGSLKPSEEIAKAIIAGDDTYDFIAAPPKRVELAGAATSGYLYDLNSLKYIDTSKPWWDEGAVDSLTIDGKLFFCTGDIIILDDSQSWIVYFNKELFDDASIEYPYKQVDEGKWTIDAMYRIAQDMSADLNGDGVMDENDRFGLITEYSCSYNLIAGFGEKIAGHDEKGGIKLTAYNERISDGLDKALMLFNDKHNVLTVEDYSHVDNYWVGFLINKFKSNGSAMIISYLNYITGSYRDMAANYGILPLPKLDESQDRYYTPVNFNFSSAVAVPKCAKSPDDSAFVLEALAAESKNTLTPAFVDVSMKRKQSRDEESIGMLDIIMSSLTYDIGQFFNWGGLYSAIIEQAKSGENTYASKYASLKDSALTAIDTLMKNIG